LRLSTNQKHLTVDVHFCDHRWQSPANRAKVAWSEINAKAQLGLKLPTDRAVVPLDLWDADMGKVMKYLYFDHEDRSKYGHLPMMALYSRGSIAANSAVSFCERINSAANLVVTKGNSLLDPEDINMMTVLRTNREFMDHMRSKDTKASGQRFNLTLVDGTPGCCALRQLHGRSPRSKAFQSNSILQA